MEYKYCMWILEKFSSWTYVNTSTFIFGFYPEQDDEEVHQTNNIPYTILTN